MSTITMSKFAIILLIGTVTLFPLGAEGAARTCICTAANGKGNYCGYEIEENCEADQGYSCSGKAGEVAEDVPSEAITCAKKLADADGFSGRTGGLCKECKLKFF